MNNYNFYDNYMPYYLDREKINSVNNIANNKLFGPYEGYIKGNMFKEIYDPYKNYKVMNIKINNEKDEMLLNINELSFKLHDINLYLDIYSNDSNMINEYNKTLREYNEMLKNYEQKYGNLFVKRSLNIGNKWNWENNWPWDGGNK